MIRVCVIDGVEFDTTRPHALYCSQRCTQKAYRQRQTAKRLAEARERRQSAEQQHRDSWLRFLMDAGTSRKQAERLFVALTSIGRLDGEPYEQLTLPG